MTYQQVLEEAARLRAGSDDSKWDRYRAERIAEAQGKLVTAGRPKIVRQMFAAVVHRRGIPFVAAQLEVAEERVRSWVNAPAVWLNDELALLIEKKLGKGCVTYI